jgi:hypothetical protein
VATQKANRSKHEVALPSLKRKKKSGRNAIRSEVIAVGITIKYFMAAP